MTAKSRSTINPTTIHQALQSPRSVWPAQAPPSGAVPVSPCRQTQQGDTSILVGLFRAADFLVVVVAFAAHGRCPFIVLSNTSNSTVAKLVLLSLMAYGMTSRSL